MLRNWWENQNANASKLKQNDVICLGLFLTFLSIGICSDSFPPFS